MKRLSVCLVVVILVMTQWILPAKAADKGEIEQLKKQMERQTEELNILKTKIDELEKKQAEPTISGEVGKKASEADKKGLLAGYDKGFYIKTPDEKFSLRQTSFSSSVIALLILTRKLMPTMRTGATSS